MNEQVQPGWQKCLPQGADGQKAHEQKDHDADHRAQDRNVIEQEGHGSPQHGVTDPADRRDGGGCQAHGQVHDRDREQIDRYIPLDLLGDFDRLPLVLERR